MTHTDILKYALALGEQRDIYDKTNNKCYIPNVDTNGKWLGILILYDSGYSEFYSFDSEQNEITQNLIDFVIDFIEANDDAEYEIREYFPEILAHVEGN